MKILYITDTHFTAKSPYSRIDNYQITTLRKLLEIGKIIEDNDIDMVLHGGDMFHTAKVSLKYAGNIAEIIKEWKIPVYVVPGNHDLYGYNLSTIEQTILGLFEKSGVIHLLTRDNPLQFDVKGKTLVIEGQEYYGDIDKGNPKDFEVDSISGDYNILVTHSMLMPKPFHPDVPHTLISDVNTDANMVLAGHYHPGFDDVFLNGTYFLNPGSLLRVECSRADIPKALIIDVDVVNGKLDAMWNYVKLNTARKQEEVFDISSKVIKNQNRIAVEEFKNNIDGLSSLKDSKSITDMVQSISNQGNISSNITNIALKYITNAEILDDSTNVTINGYIPKSNPISFSKVHIKNFQSHSNSVIEFENGMNAIIGESGQGKTSILRAIKWCLYNEPKGKEFIRTGEKDCTVTIEFSDGSSITRHRTVTSSGYYKVKDCNGNIQEYKGFGNDMPVEILNEHNMPEVFLSKDKKCKLNFAEQLEGPFLIGESSSVKASAIGRLTGVQVLDLASKECNKGLLNINKEIKALSSQLDEYNKEMHKYDNLEDQKLYLKILEELLLHKNKYQEEIEQLNYYQDTLNKLRLEKEEKELYLSSLNDIDKLDALMDELTNTVYDLEYYNSVFNNLEKVKRDKLVCNNNIRLISSYLQIEGLTNTVYADIQDLEVYTHYKKCRLDLYNQIKYTKNLLNSYDNIETFSNLIDNIDNDINLVLEQINYDTQLGKLNWDKCNCNKNMSEIDNEIKSVEASLETAKNNISVLIEKEEVCPICGSQMNLQHVLEE